MQGEVAQLIHVAQVIFGGWARFFMVFIYGPLILAVAQMEFFLPFFQLHRQLTV
jgi:hypothetical protein